MTASLKSRLAASDAVAVEMTRLRVLVHTCESQGRWLDAAEARKQLKEAHELNARRDYSDRHQS